MKMLRTLSFSMMVFSGTLMFATWNFPATAMAAEAECDGQACVRSSGCGYSCNVGSCECVNSECGC